MLVFDAAARHLAVDHPFAGLDQIEHGRPLWMIAAALVGIDAAAEPDVVLDIALNGVLAFDQVGVLAGDGRAPGLADAGVPLEVVGRQRVGAAWRGMLAHDASFGGGYRKVAGGGPSGGFSPGGGEAGGTGSGGVSSGGIAEGGESGGGTSAGGVGGVSFGASGVCWAVSRALQAASATPAARKGDKPIVVRMILSCAPG